MQKKYLLITVALLLTCLTNAQAYLNINWENKNSSILQDSENNLYGLFSNHYVEYVNSEFSNQAFIYETHHMKAKINKKTDDSIDEIFISKINVSEIMDIKAKVFKKDTVHIYNFSEMKKLRTSESSENYDYYKIPNINEKDIVEMMYTVKKDFNFNGNKLIEESFPIISSKFILIENEFKSNIKIYNSKNSNIKDTIIDNKRGKYVEFKNIKPTTNEQYATPVANKIKIAYQCYINDDDFSQNEYWTNLVKNVEELFFPKSTNQKAVDLLKEIKYNSVKIPHNEIIIANAIDEYVKNNFIISGEEDPNLNDINYIFKNKISNDFSIIQVYTNLLKEAKVNYEVAISCNRYFHKFDPDFFDPNQLREFVIYLPDFEKYISPNRIEYRISEAPDDLIGNYGIFIDKDLEYYFSEITLSDENFSQIKKNIQISIPKSLKKLKIQESRSFSGYWAIMNRNYIYLSETEKTDFLVDYFTINGLDNKKVTKYSIENYDFSNNKDNAPLVINSTILTTDLIEKNSSLISLKIGKVIGAQSNLFDENNRINPIEINFPNEYEYKIAVNIPKGYEVFNYQELNRSNEYISVDGNLSAKFKSVAKVKDDQLEITIYEYYKQLRYDKARYEEFRKVINTAAKFYESSLVLKKS